MKIVEAAAVIAFFAVMIGLGVVLTLIYRAHGLELLLPVCGGVVMASLLAAMWLDSRPRR